MDLLLNPHDVRRTTFNAICVECCCGATFFGDDRLTAMDAYVGHVIATRSLDTFKLTESQK